MSSIGSGTSYESIFEAEHEPHYSEVSHGSPLPEPLYQNTEPASGPPSAGPTSILETLDPRRLLGGGSSSPSANKYLQPEPEYQNVLQLPATTQGHHHHHHHR